MPVLVLWRLDCRKKLKEGRWIGLIDKNTLDEKALLSVKEMCIYLSIGQTKCRELLSDPVNGFTVRIGNRLYAHMCNKVYREGHELQNIADYSGTFYNPNHNESLLPCNRRYDHI